MRERNWRLVRVGGVLLGFAVVVFVAMLVIAAPSSPDNAEMIHRIGQVMGAIGGVGVALAIIGLIGKKVPAG
jgi:hypothetical protein